MPRWLLALPDAIRQLDALDRDLLTRRDLERLFGVSKVPRRRPDDGLRRRPDRAPADPAARRAPAPAPPAPDTGRLPRRGDAPRPGRHRDPPGPAHRDPGRGAQRGLEARLAGLPDGVSVEPGRIEARFSSAQDAVGRLFALAQALTNDYEQFEALVEEGEAAGGGGALRVEDEAV